LQDFVVPEAQQFPAEAVQIASPLVVDSLAVLTSVCLNDDPALGTCEIGDAAANRLLLLEFETAQSAVA